jgi:hypothetical protein
MERTGGNDLGCYRQSRRDMDTAIKQPHGQTIGQCTDDTGHKTRNGRSLKGPRNTLSWQVFRPSHRQTRKEYQANSGVINNAHGATQLWHILLERLWIFVDEPIEISR